LPPKFVIPFYLPPENEMMSSQPNLIPPFNPMNNMMPQTPMNVLNPNFPPMNQMPQISPIMQMPQTMQSALNTSQPNNFSMELNQSLPGSNTSSINISNQQLASILSNITSLKSSQASNNSSQSKADAENEPPTDSNDADLPPNWKSAKTSFGKVYFYNTTTKQTQWEKPVAATSPAKKTPQRVEKAKAIEEKTYKSKSASAFKKEASKVVISLLQLYLKGKMSYGRITNSDDFKYLARYFTHYILDKEVEKQGEDSVRFSSKIKDRISEYVSSYMKRQGPLYKRTK